MVKNPPASAGNTGREDLLAGHGDSVQYSCLGSPMARGAWQATVMGSQRVRHNLVTKQQ